jgi:large conductance mechanosensitive channel
MWKEFKEFALRGNVLDMAVGIIIGAAFTTVVKSVVDDVIMPPIGLLLGDVQFQDMFLQLEAGDPAGPYATLAAAREAGAVVIGYGALVNNVVSFLIVAFVVFVFVRTFNRLRRSEEGASADEPTTRTCPECLSTIPVKATRCAHCTMELGPISA